MESTISDDLQERIVQQHTVSRKTASNYYVVALCSRIKQVPQLRHQMRKITVHGQNVSAGGIPVPVSQSATDAVRRLPENTFDERLLRLQRADHVSSFVRAVVIDENYLMKVITIKTHKPCNKRPDIHLL